MALPPLTPPRTDARNLTAGTKNGTGTKSVSKAFTKLAVVSPTKALAPRKTRSFAAFTTGWEEQELRDENGLLYTASVLSSHSLLATKIQEKGLHFLHAYEIARYFKPQGSLRWDEIPSELPEDFPIGAGGGRDELREIHKRLQVLLEGEQNVELPRESLWSLLPQTESATEFDAACKSGKIHFSGTIKKTDSNSAGFVLSLRAARTGAGCRFYREFGSDRFLRISIEEGVEYALTGSSKSLTKLSSLLSSPLIIMSRHYRPFCHKDGAIILFAESGPGIESISLARFLEGHISPGLNEGMGVGKFVSRFELGLSTTIPTLVFERNQIIRVPDIMSNTLSISATLVRSLVGLLRTTDEDTTDGRFPMGYLPSTIEGSYFDRADKSGNRFSMIWRLDHDSFETNEPTKRIQLYDFVDGHRPAFVAITFGFTNLAGEVRSVQHRVVNSRPSVTTSLSSRPTHQSTDTPSSPPEIEWIPRRSSDEKAVVMTDGCGLISGRAMREACDLFSRAEERLGEGTPGAVQGRILCAKGVWSPLLATPWSEEIWIEVRESQVKWNASPSKTQAPLEVLRVTGGRGRCRIGKQTFEILAHGGVPHEVPRKMLRDLTKDYLDVLTDWEDPARLLYEIENKTSVFAERTLKSARANGQQLAGEWGTNEEENEEFAELDSRFAEGLWDPNSAAPSMLSSVVVESLLAGMTPNQHPLLAGKIALVAADYIRKNVSFRMDSASSRSVMVIADPFQVLKEGQVFYQSSEPIHYAHYSSPILLGPALVSRAPTVLPSDIQKAIGIFHPLFAHLSDVLVFSSLGTRSACSLLAGGDYDGDTILLITDQAIVEPFKSAGTEFVDPPFEDEEWFEVDSGKVEGIRGMLEGGNSEGLGKVMIRSLFQSSRFGRLSKFHTRLSYTHGVAHPLTVECAHLFARSLDGRNQGLTITGESWTRMERKFGPGRVNMPRWTKLEELGVDWSDSTGIVWAKRGDGLGRHVLDELAKEGIRAIRSSEERFKILFATMPVSIDTDIASLFVDAWNELHAVLPLSAFARDLERIWSHVEKQYKSFAAMRGNWREAKSRSATSVQSSPSKVTKLRTSKKYELLGATEGFWSILEREEFESAEFRGFGGRILGRRLLASCAYALPFGQKSPSNPFLLSTSSRITLSLPSYLAKDFSRSTTDKSFAFAFDLAHREILGIKADAVARREFRGVDVGALRIVPMLQNVVGVSKRCIQISKTQIISRPLTLLPTPLVDSSRLSADIPSPSKKARLDSFPF